MRRIFVNGSDGNMYTFLLKAHEDLRQVITIECTVRVVTPRQDERVMQLFGLLNTFLNKDLVTSHRHLDIKV